MLAVLVGGIGSILAASQPGDIPYPWNLLVNYGVLGAVVVLWLTGNLASKRELNRETKRADAAETDKATLNSKAFEMAPLLFQATQLMADLKPQHAQPTNEILSKLESLANQVNQLKEK